MAVADFEQCFELLGAYKQGKVIEQRTGMDVLMALDGKSCIEPGSSSMNKWLFIFRYLNRLKELPAELSEHKFEQLTESSKMSNLTKEEFEAYQKVYHKEYDHNAMVDGIFEEFADEINAKVASSVQDREREMARNMLAEGDSVEKISRITHLSEEEIRKL